MTAIRNGRQGHRLSPTVSREVTATSNAVDHRTRAPSGASPGAQTARPNPERAIVSDTSMFSALARIIGKECSGDRFPPRVRPDDAAVLITRLVVLADVVGRLLRR